MALLYYVLLNSLGHLAFVGSRMTTSLFALRLGASAFTVGLLMALFALLPMLLSVSAGRLIDRVGPRRPVLVAYGGLIVATLLPFAFPSLATLFASTVLAGTSFMLLHIGMNSVFGGHGTPEQRAVTFSWLALGFSASNSVGPLVAGYSIDGFGHARAFLVLAFFPALGFLMLALRKRPLPRPHGTFKGSDRALLDLLRIHALRNAFIVSLLLAMGWDLYTFLMPLYGARLGLPARTIGLVMSTFALATFAVRLALPFLIRRLRQWSVIAGGMSLAGSSYLLFPLADSAPPAMALSFALGLGLGCAQPIIMSLLYEASPPGRQSEAVGLRTSLLNGSQTLIPLASGALSVALGMAPVFVLLALFLLSGAWFARQRIELPK